MLSAPRVVAVAVVALASWAGPQPLVSRADTVDDVGKKLFGYQEESRSLRQAIRRPDVNKGNQDKASRRLIDAQVAFGLGNYDDAAVMLYDVVAKFRSNRVYPQALYYLAESLFQKGDYQAARTYFTRLMRELPNSKFQQQSLERLIELALKLNDQKDVTEWLQALDKVPSVQRRASVAYVRGKYAYFANRFDEAVAWFDRVSTKQKYYFQAQYFKAAALAAKRDLVPAMRVYDELTKRQPRNKDDETVLELSHLGLGRLLYECKGADECGIKLTAQEERAVRKKHRDDGLTAKELRLKIAEARDKKVWSKAIDQYLMISRRSEFFDESLFEIAWVYVKNRNFDKALRALELLALADPDSARLPEVKILEGSLRIRRGQRLEFANTGNSAEEYDRAFKAFDTTRQKFRKSHDELHKIMTERHDLRKYMQQITGRATQTFDVGNTMSPAAIDWLRKEPDVERVVIIENDLGQIADEIKSAEKTISRLQHALTDTAGVNVFPALAEKRSRSIEILEAVTGLRAQLLDEERKLVYPQASASEKTQISALRRARKDAEKRLQALPNADVPFSKRIEKARGEFVELDKKSSQVRFVVEAAQATLIAVEKYLIDTKKRRGVEPALKPDDQARVKQSLAEIREQITAMKADLVKARNEIVLARDAAGTGDAAAKAAALARAQFALAIDAEHRFMASIAKRLRGPGSTKTRQIAQLMMTANSAILTSDETKKAIDEVVNSVLGEVRDAVDEERAKLVAYKAEFTAYTEESELLGGQALAASMGAVRDRFRGYLIRSDAGIIDISWAQREFADKTLKTLEVDKRREITTLVSDFGDVLPGSDSSEESDSEADGESEGGDADGSAGDTDSSPEGGTADGDAADGGDTTTETTP